MFFYYYFYYFFLNYKINAMLMNYSQIILQIFELNKI